MPGIVTAAAAVVRMRPPCCKDREDSFMTETPSKMWDSLEPFAEEDVAFVNSTNDWLTSLNLKTRQKVVASPAVKTKKGNAKAASYGDENRCEDSNVDSDRLEAMKAATKPCLKAVAERQPSLSELASARFKQSVSMQQSRARASERNKDRSGARPGSPHGSDTKSLRQREWKDVLSTQINGGFTPGTPMPPSFLLNDRLAGHASPRAGGHSFALIERVSGHSSPPRPATGGHSFALTERSSGHASPRAPGHAFALHERGSGHASPPMGGHRIVLADRSGHASPRAGSPGGARSGYSSPCAGKGPARAMVRAPSPRPRDADTEAFVVYQASDGSASVPPEHLQHREMGRWPSSELRSPRLQSFGTNSAACTPHTTPSSLFSGDAKPATRSAPKKLVAAPRQDPAPQDDTTIPEATHIAQKPRGVNHVNSGPLSDAGVELPHASNGGLNLGEKMGRPSTKQAAARARSATIFWHPPPPAKAICETEKSPSFLLNAKAEAPARPARTPAREATDASDFNYNEPRSGTASSQAVMAAVCSTMGSSLLQPSPSMHHRQFQQMHSPIASFSVVPARPVHGGGLGMGMKSPRRGVYAQVEHI